MGGGGDDSLSYSSDSLTFSLSQRRHAVSPVSPVGPVGPVSPVSPSVPASPTTPKAPRGPARPCGLEKKGCIFCWSKTMPPPPPPPPPPCPSSRYLVGTYAPHHAFGGGSGVTQLTKGGAVAGVLAAVATTTHPSFAHPVDTPANTSSGSSVSNRTPPALPHVKTRSSRLLGGATVKTSLPA